MPVKVVSSSQKPVITTSSWLVIPRPNPQAKLRLFCFPYAGAGPVVYRAWVDDLPSQVELVSLLYPGRESRLREPAYVSIQPLLSALMAEILPYLDQPFAFYGHSLGALIAFELARGLRRQQAPQPQHMFLSSRRSLHLPERFPAIHVLSDDSFARAIQERYNGIPAVIQQDPELMALFLPILKADFSILETYQYEPEPAFNFPLSIYGGTQDQHALEEELAAWKFHTTRSCTVQMFPGDHFFIQSQRAALLAAISQVLTFYLQ